MKNWFSDQRPSVPFDRDSERLLQDSARDELIETDQGLSCLLIEFSRFQKSEMAQKFNAVFEK